MTEKVPPTLTAGHAVEVLARVAAELRSGSRTIDARTLTQVAEHLEHEARQEAQHARDKNWEASLITFEADKKYSNDWKLESLRATMTLAGKAINAAVLINGGAAVALLAYASKATWTGLLGYALLCFAGGVLLASLTFGSSYLAQLEYTNAAVDERDAGTRWHIGAVVLGLLSFAMFGVGSYMSYQALSASDVTVVEERRNAPPPKPVKVPVYPEKKPAEKK